MSSPAPNSGERNYEIPVVFLPEVLLNDSSEPTPPTSAAVGGFEHRRVALPEVNLDSGEVVPLAEAEKPQNTPPPACQDKKSA
jgi:hypothetical protein